MWKGKLRELAFPDQCMAWYTFRNVTLKYEEDNDLYIEQVQFT